MNDLVIVRGAGDLATGIIQKLFTTGYSVLALELDKPLCIRRQVAFSECIYTGEVVVEEIKAIHIKNISEFDKTCVNVMIDPDTLILKELKPKVFIDATLAKRDLGTNMEMAEFVIGVGPSFITGVNCHVVVETKRGHNLGRLIYDGAAVPDTKVPGNIGGYTHERVIHAPGPGILNVIKTIGDEVKKDEVIARIMQNDMSVKIEVQSKIDGFIRGMLRDQSYVTEGLKIADVDPRLGELDNCFTVSDKARNIAGGVLEAIICMERMDKNNSRFSRIAFNNNKKDIAGIILASGLSVRFNSNKLIQKIMDKTIFEHSLINAIEADIFKEIIVVTSYDEVVHICQEYPTVRVVENRNNKKGISESIKLGVRNASDFIDGFMFIMADQPYIKAETFHKISKAFQENDKIIIPRFVDTFGSPKVFPKRFEEELLQLQGDNGGREIIKKHQNEVFPVRMYTQIDNKDIDYQEDLGSE